MDEHAPGDRMDELTGDCFFNRSEFLSGNSDPPEVQQHEHPVVDIGDWRAQVSPDVRNNVIKHIMDNLKKHVRISGQSELSELPMAAKRFEEKVFFSSASKYDYLRKIKMKMMTVEAAASRNNLNASQNAPLQLQSQGQSFPVSVEKNQLRMLQQLQQEDISNNITSFRMQGSSSPQTAQSSLSNLNAAHLSHGAADNVNMSNTSGVPQTTTAVPSMFVSSRGMQPVQQLVPQQQLYMQQSSQHPLNKNLQLANVSRALMQPYVQQGQLQQHQIQQQQLQSQDNMLQFSQQYFLQTPSSVQPTLMQPTQISNCLQLNQRPLHQLTRSLLPQQKPTIPRPRQQQQSFISPMKTSALQQPNQMLPQQVVVQQKSMRCPSDIAYMQQNQSGQLNCIPEIQQQRWQPQKEGFLGPQSTPASIQLQQQPLMLPQSNQYLNLEQQHATESGKSILHCAAEGSMLNQSRVSGQGQQNMPTLQSARCQLRNAQHFARTQPPSLQKQICLKQQSNLLQEGLQPRNPQFELPEQQNLIHQQRQIFQPQGVPPDLSSNSLELVDQPQENVGSSFLEAIYQKQKAMKDSHLPMLYSLYNKVVAAGDMGPNTSAERQKVYNGYKFALEHLIRTLTTPKNCITPSHESRLEYCERQIAKLRSLQHISRPTTSLQQAQQPQFPTTQVQQSENQMNSQLLSQQQNSQQQQGNMIGSMPRINSGSLQHSLDTNQHVHINAVASPTTENLLHMKPQPMHVKQQQMHRQKVHQVGTIGEGLKQTPLSSEHSPYPNQLQQIASPHNSGNTPLVDSSTQLKPSVSSQSLPLLASTPASFSAPPSTNGTEKPNAISSSLPEVPHPNPSETLPDKTNTEELPMDRLLRVIKLLSPRTLKESINDLKSVVAATDMLALSVSGKGSRASLGVDLADMIKTHLQDRTCTFDGACETVKMKRYISAVSSSVILSNVNDSSGQQSCGETSEMISSETSSIKLSKYASILKDIREINSRMIDTVLDVCHEDTGEIGDCEGMVVRCSFIAVAMSKELKSHYTSGDVLPIQPLRLLVPSDYPASSPILLDQQPSESSGTLEDLSWKAKSKLHEAMKGLSQSALGEVARMWEECCHQTILEYTQKTGGGTFTSQYGAWEDV